MAQTFLTNEDKVELDRKISERVAITTEEVSTTYVNESGTGDVVTTTAAYIDANGTIQYTGAWRCTDFVLVPAGAAIAGEFVNNSNISAVAFYDVNKVFVSSLHHDTTSLNFHFLVDTEVPAGAAYVRFSFIADGNAHQFARVTETAVMEDFVRNIEKGYDRIAADSVANAYVNRGGELESTSSWWASDFVRVNHSFVIDFNLYGTASTSLMAFYDKDKKHISSITNDTAGLHEVIGAKPPKNAYYMRYASFTGQQNQYVRTKYKRLETLEVEHERSLWDNPLYKKILTATGDSITATVSYRPYCYAKMIASKNSMAYENKAIWGATVASGIEGSSGCILDTVSTMREDADYIILSGGANDFYALSAGREQLGEISNGYTATLDTSTFCGAVEQMCKTAIERWPGKKIMYVITHRMLDISNENLQTWVARLVEILDKWGIPCVDLWHDMPSLALPALKNLYTTMGNTEYTGTGDGLHPNEDGLRKYYAPRIEAKMKAI